MIGVRDARRGDERMPPGGSAAAAGAPRRRERTAARGSRRGLLIALVAVVTLAVAAGAIGARAIIGHSGTAARVHPTPAATATPGVPTILPPDAYRHVDCVIPPPSPRMMTPAELASPIQVGYTYNEDGNIRRCTKPGLNVPAPPGGVPGVSGQVILVSLGMQWLWAYQDGKLAFANPVTTGKEWLWTPQGTYHIQYKVTDTTFYSPWPPGSPYYYEPEHVNYAMFFRDKGYYIHDAPWRHAFGPGTNVPHTDPDGTRETGSHGCVNLPVPAAAWLFNWVQIGATVRIEG